MAGGRARIFRRRRRVPHGVSLSADAADVHGDRAGGPAPRHRDHAADAGHPGQLPVGDLPAQPRRAHARDGHEQGARLHVPDVRRRPARAHQRRHPPPPGAAARERRRPHQADEQPAAVDARLADPLLRRRDRHGRQHLPRRPRRRAHADAVEAGAQRRLLARRPAAAVPAARSWTRSTATRPSTSRRSCASRRRCSTGRGGCSRCARGFSSFGRGSSRFLRPGNRKILAYVREYGDEVRAVRRQPVAAWRSRSSSTLRASRAACRWS